MGTGILSYSIKSASETLTYFLKVKNMNKPVAYFIVISFFLIFSANKYFLKKSFSLAPNTGTSFLISVCTFCQGISLIMLGIIFAYE